MLHLLLGVFNIFYHLPIKKRKNKDARYPLTYPIVFHIEKKNAYKKP